MSKHTQSAQQKIKTGSFGPKLDSMDMQNNPFRAMVQHGHGLNESYKIPTPNSLGQNLSYHNPLHGGRGVHPEAKMMQVPDKKNTF